MSSNPTTERSSRNRESCVVTLSHHADRSHIIRTKYSGRTDGTGEQANECSHAAFHGVVAFHDQGRIRFEADLLHRTEERLLAARLPTSGARAGNKSDFFVTQRRQMLHRLTDTVKIVDPNIAHARARRANVDKDQRHFP